VQNNYLWDDEEGGSKTLAGSSIVGFINETTYVPGGGQSSSPYAFVSKLNDDPTVRNDAISFYRDNPLCEKAVNNALKGSNTLNKIIDGATFVDVTKDARAAALDVITQITGRPLSVVQQGKRVYSYESLGQNLQTTIGITSRVSPVAYFGQNYASKSLSFRRLAAGHEVLHLALGMGHVRLARQLGVKFQMALDNSGAVDIGSTELSASAAINRWLKKGCNPLRSSALEDFVFGSDPVDDEP
jgi:hypothetical protein